MKKSGLTGLAQHWLALLCVAVMFCLLNFKAVAQIDSALYRAPKRLHLVGPNLFVAAYGRGVQVLDVSDGRNPKWKGGWNPRRSPESVQVVDGYAFVADRIAGLTVLDVKDPANPIWVTTVDTPGDAHGLHVVGKTAYVADGHSTYLLAFDISDPRRPELLRRFETGFNGPKSIQVVGNTAYVNCVSQILLISLSNPEGTDIYARCNPGGFCEQSQTAGSITYAANGSLFSSQSSTWLARVSGGNSVFIRSNEAFVIQGNTLSISDIGRLSRDEKSNRLEARQISTLKLNGPGDRTLVGQDVVVTADVAYVLDGKSSIHVVDIADLSHPKVIGFLSSERYSSPVLAVKSPSLLTSGLSAASAGPSPAIKEPPELTNLQKLDNGAFAFDLIGIPNSSYVIQASADLKLWVDISTNIVPSSGTLKITDPQATSLLHQFYRAVMHP